MAVATARKMITIGEMVITNDPTSVNLIVGSCVGVIIYDPLKKTFAITHTIYPEFTERSLALGKKKTFYVDTAIEEMIAELQKRGSSVPQLQAKIIGGANMFENLEPVGDKNVVVARKTLEEHKIPLVAEDTGGRSGRKIEPMNSEGKIKVIVHKSSTEKDVTLYI